MDHIVYLPVHKHVPDSELQRMAQTVRYVLSKYSSTPPAVPAPAQLPLPSKL